MHSIYGKFRLARVTKSIWANVAEGGEKLGVICNSRDHGLLSSLVCCGRTGASNFHRLSNSCSTDYLSSFISKLASSSALNTSLTICPIQLLELNKCQRLVSKAGPLASFSDYSIRSIVPACKDSSSARMRAFTIRSISTTGISSEPVSQDTSPPVLDSAPRVKFKRLDKTARHIMQIIDREAVEEVKAQREMPEIRPGYIVQLKVVVPENKRRVSIMKGIVIARRNAGLNSTFRLRRVVAGVGVESLFPLYSPNIKEIKVLDKKKVRRAKLYYLRDKMNALK